jgi:hypothetical protein
VLLVLDQVYIGLLVEVLVELEMQILLRVVVVVGVHPPEVLPGQIMHWRILAVEVVVIILQSHLDMEATVVLE